MAGRYWNLETVSSGIVSLSDDQIADMLSGRNGPVVSRFVLEQRDLSFALVADVSAAFLVDRGGSIDCQPEAIARTAQITVLPDALPFELDAPDVYLAIAEYFYSTLLADWVRFDLGLFRIDDYEHDDFGADGQEPTASLQLADVATILMDPTDDVYTVAAASNYMTAIATLLTARGLASMLPAIVETVPVAHSWAPKTPGRSIADVLAQSVNYYPVWPDVQGVFTTRERVNPFTEAPDVVYSEDDEPRMIIAPLRRSSSKTDYRNRAVVLQNHPQRLPNGYELRENADPASAISTANLGADLEEIRAPLVFDLTVAGEWAEWYLRDQALRSLRAELQTFRDPRRGVLETYQLFYGAEVGTLWRQLGWSYPLEPGAVMQHTIGLITDVEITEPT